jgi:hypothetical protein
MFSFFRHRAAANTTCTAAAVLPNVASQSAIAVAAPAEDATAAEQPATHEELMPYLMLAMVAGV